MLKLQDNRFIIIDIIVIYLNSEQANFRQIHTEMQSN